MAKMRKQILAFCQAYLKNPENNAAQAARDAGYSVKTARTKASQLLTRVDVKRYLAKFLDKQEKRTEINVDWVLEQLKTVASICMAQEPSVKGGKVKFDSSGANKALELIGRNKKMFTDKIEQDTTITVIRKQYKSTNKD